ncbi:sigma 54-interacting transcriptional regulator [bacterium]|nr:sigma 54-interacting transcriptional regulator [bacterium]
MAKKTLPVLHARYDVQELMAEGGMSLVYKAWDRLTGRHVIIKKNSGTNEQFFAREYRLVSPLHHPNIPEMYTYHRIGNDIFFSMETIEGKSLADNIVSKQMTAKLFYTTFLQLLSALDYLHQHRIIHHDLKPANILLTSDPDAKIKLIDFGLALTAEDKPDHVLQGTVQYTAPEILKKETYDHRSDLYSLGVILYEWLTGANPFDDFNVVNIVVSHLEKKIETIDSQFGFIQEWLKKIVLKLLIKDQNYRYQNVGEIIADLRPHQTDIESALGHPADFNEVYLNACLLCRDNELSALEKSQPHQPVFIIGDEGVGKTVLLKKFVENLQLTGRHNIHFTISGYYRSLETMKDFLKSVLFSTPNPVDESKEEIQWILGKTESFSVHDESSLFSIMSDFVIQRIGLEFTYIVIDDADRADPFLQNFFKYLIRKINLQQNVTVTFVLAGHDDSIVQLASDETSQSIKLESFSEQQTTEVARHLLNTETLDVDFLRWLFSSTRGNPFLIENTIKAAIEQNALIFKNKDWRWFAEHMKTTSLSINEFVLSKVLYLSPTEKKIIEAASLFPGVFSYDALLATGIAFEFSYELDKLLRQNILAREGNALIFNNRFLREHIYDQIKPSDKNKLHNFLAVFYETHFPESFGDIAYHYFRSTEKAKALDFLQRLADYQKNNFQYRDSLRSCLEICEILQETKQDELLAEQFFSMEALQDQLGERRAQKESIDEIIGIGKKHPDKKFLVKGLLREANYFERISDYESSQKTCEEAIELTKNRCNEYLLGQLYRQLGKSFYRRAKWEQALEWYQETHRIAIETNDHRLEMEAHNSMGTVYGSKDDFEKGRLEFESALSIALKLGDYAKQIDSYFNLGILCKNSNRIEQASEYFLQALPVLKSYKDKQLEQRYFYYQGLVYYEISQFEDAHNYFSKTLDLSVELNDLGMTNKALSNLSLTLMRLGQVDQSISILDKVLKSEKNNDDRTFAIHSLLMAEQLFFMKKYAAISSYLENGASFFKKNAHPFWSVYTKILLMRFAVETNFVLISKERLNEETESIEKFVGEIQSSDSSIQILGFFVLSKLFQKNDTHHAKNLLLKSLQLLELRKHFEYSAQEIWFQYYLIEDPQEKIKRSHYLQKAYLKIREVESFLKRSDFKTSYLNIPLHQEIIQEYKKFFDEERESDIQSFQQLYEITQDINSTLDSSIVFEKIMDNAIKHSRADRGLIILNTGQTDTFEIKVARNMDHESLSDISNISQSIVKEVFENGQSIVTADANMDERFKERKSIVNYHIRSIMCVPLRIKNKIAGAVYLDKQFDTYHFGTPQLKFLESFANLAGLAIDNASMYEAVYNEKENLEKENVDLKLTIQGKYITHNIVGRSKPMRQVYHLIESAANNTATVLIEGESGTGKELVARAIHYNGNRKNQKFIAVDCGALPENLLESELFGYKKGAFTGANHDKKGLFEEADGGTIFLDEITNTSLNFQAKLLRVIQEGEIRPVGETLSRRVNVRIIAATNKDLAKQVEQNLFREDLYYRLNVIPIRLPALRERKEDVPFLLQFFIEKYSQAERKHIESVSKDLVDAMMEYSWPGNIRELENIVQRMIIFSNSKKLSFDNLNEDVRSPFERKQSLQSKMIVHLGGKHGHDKKLKNLGEFEEELLAIERGYFEQILKNAGGNKSKAAEILGIKRTTLNDRLKKLGL